MRFPSVSGKVGTGVRAGCGIATTAAPVEVQELRDIAPAVAVLVDGDQLYVADDLPALSSLERYYERVRCVSARQFNITAEFREYAVGRTARDTTPAKAVIVRVDRTSADAREYLRTELRVNIEALDAEQRRTLTKGHLLALRLSCDDRGRFIALDVA